MRRVLLLLPLLASCDQDVRLGAQATPDASPQPDAMAAASPTYSLQFGALTTECDGSLVGRAEELDNGNAMEAGFYSGTVGLMWIGENALSIHGAPILQSFQIESIGLMSNVVPEQPDGIILGLVELTGSAPLGMVKEAGMLSVEVAPADSTQWKGQAAVLYTSSNQDGSCSLTINLTITKDE